ncbi:Olfactory Receptor 5V1 [Manis pentadactyla]|nr:Olfactory Receptor 5V1 [Manis pentadactyla]
MERKLCTPMYYFLASLSLLAIFCPSATVPKMLDNLLTGNHSISFLGCALQVYFLVALSLIDMVVFVGREILGIGAFLTTFISYIYIVSAILKIQSVEGKRKAFTTCASHLLVVCLFYGTAIFTYMQPSSGGHSPTGHSLIPMLYGVITTMLNPMIYSLRNREVKGAVGSVFCHGACLQEMQ